MIQQAIAKLFAHQDLTATEAEEANGEIMSGTATPAQIGAYLAALRMKGETRDEIVGSARAMRAKALMVHTSHPILVDTCGTGGDKSGTFNISTTAAFVVAAADVPVAKHGNRAMSSQAGSADVLSALGVKVDLQPDQVAQCIEEVGIGFMLAPVHHPAMKHVVGVRTIFNILGPLTNPAGAKHQLLGVPDPGLTELMASVLGELGSTHVLVVNTAGVDELLTTDPAVISELRNGEVTTYMFDPLDMGMERTTLEELGGGTPDFNAAITRSILQGDDVAVRMNVVLLNAGAALYAADAASSIKDGIALAREVIKNGKAIAKLDALVEKSQSFA